MARYEHLPIYKQAFDAAVHFEKVVAEILSTTTTVRLGSMPMVDPGLLFAARKLT